MVELHALEYRKKSLFKLCMMFAGVVLFLAGLAGAGLTFALNIPPLIPALLFFSSLVPLFLGKDFNAVERVKPIPLSPAHTNQLVRWRESGELVALLDGISQGQVLSLHEELGKMFGSYTLYTFQYKSKPKDVKARKVGVKFLIPAGWNEAGVALLYRRDLAAKMGIKRPWRKAWRSVGPINFSSDGYPIEQLNLSKQKLVELPSWI